MASVDSFIYWCASRPEDEDIGFEDEMPLDEDARQTDGNEGKGKAREMKAITEAKLEIDWADGDFLFNKEGRPEGEVEFVGRDAREKELIRGLVLSPQKSGKGGRFVRYVI